MTHDANKELQESSLIGRILSMETFLMIMGIASLAYGIINQVTMNIFWGIVIVPGVVLLHIVRKRDWTKHWQELEAEHKMMEERENRRRAAAQDARKGDHHAS